MRLWRDIGPDDVHFFLNRKADVWELTVVTLDKPYLFSNICGVLSYCDLDILRGHALTSRERAGPGRVPVHRSQGMPGSSASSTRSCRTSWPDALDITALLQEKERQAPRRTPDRRQLR